MAHWGRRRVRKGQAEIQLEEEERGRQRIRKEERQLWVGKREVWTLRVSELERKVCTKAVRRRERMRLRDLET